MGLQLEGTEEPEAIPHGDSVSIRCIESSGSARQVNPQVRFLALLRLALPSILLQSGAPLAITFQTALIGRKATELVAAWAIVATATNAATVIFNFLVVGVTAKVTKVVAVGAWGQVGARIRLALGLALVMGLAACALLLALQEPLWMLLDASSPLVLQVARTYFYLRVVGVPPQLLVMCTSGILQGYQRVNLVAVLQGLRVLLDVVASYVSLYILDRGLVGVALGTILASCLVAAMAMVCILHLPPPEARQKIQVLAPLLPKGLASWMAWPKRGYETEGIGAAQESLLTSAEVGKGALAGDALGRRSCSVEEEERVNAVLSESMWKFVGDGLSTMLRSALVQASFFLVLACATVLGMYAVAAHQVLMQLWMINIYIADGFATAGTIVCSSLAGHLARAQSLQEQRHHLHDLRMASWRVLYLGTGAGFTLALVYWWFQEGLMSLFTHDPNTKEQLRDVWPFLVIVQPLNSIVFVYDGLIYAAQAFSYMAACLTVGFVALFLPCILLAYLYFKTLLAAWAAKGVLNILRFIVAGYRIHFGFLDPPLEDLAPFSSLPQFPHDNVEEMGLSKEQCVATAAA